MTDAAPQSPIASPCVLVCQIEPGTGYCWGCGRTVTEITGWSLYDDARRAAVMDALPERMDALPERAKRETRRRRRARERADPPKDQNP